MTRAEESAPDLGPGRQRFERVQGRAVSCPGCIRFQVRDIVEVMSPRECSITDALSLVGERWALLVVRELSHGVRRFGGIARNTGAPRDILTTRLRKLEAVGIVRRELYSEHPPRYEYHLTEAGAELNDVLLTLMAWGDRHLNAADPPMRFQHTCGHRFQAAVVCAHCGGPAREQLHSPSGRGVITEPAS
ncbi:helix-turn-helix domain-containing protein [Streptomyces malaysiense]